MLASNVQQNESAVCVYVYIYIYIPLPSGLPSRSGHCRALGRVPCAIQCVPISFDFVYTIDGIYMSILFSRFPPAFHRGIHTFVSYVCVSISALQIRSSIPFFWIPQYMY